MSKHTCGGDLRKMGVNWLADSLEVAQKRVHELETSERELLMVLEFYASAANWKKHQHNMDKPIGGDICQGCWVSEVEKDLGSRAREAIQKAKGKG